MFALIIYCMYHNLSFSLYVHILLNCKSHLNCYIVQVTCNEKDAAIFGAFVYLRSLV